MASLIKKTSTKNENEVQLLSVGPCSYDKTLLVVAGMHGDEWQSIDMAQKMIERLEHTKNRTLYIPNLNPDGDDLGIRTNANDVDLNRNFPSKNWQLTEKDRYYGGESPLSEIETKFIDTIIKEYNPEAILTLHTPFRVVNYDGPAQQIAAKMAELSGYELQETIGYETPGSFGSYYGTEQNTPIVTLEIEELDDTEQLWRQLKSSFEYFINL